VRLTVNLIPRADKALQLAVQLTGDSKTDTVNRALQVYAYLEYVISRGSEVLIRERDGSTGRIILGYPGLAEHQDELGFLDQEQDPASR